MPPFTPNGEIRVLASDTKDILGCVAMLRRMNRQLGDHMDGSITTYSPRWGLVWRADFSSSDRDGRIEYRFVRAPRGPDQLRTIAITPLRMFDSSQDTPPLSSGSWGTVMVYK